MDVEKRGELKNKIIVGGVLTEDTMHREYPFIPSREWEMGYYVLDLNTGEVSSLPRIMLDYGSSPSMGAVGSQLYTFGDGKSVSGGNDDDSTTPKSKPKPKPTPKTKKGKRKMNQNQQQGLFSSHFLDLTKPQKGWRLAAAGVDQLKPIGVIAFGGKMYVFTESKFSFICEVFDPQHNQWRRLKSPPFPPSPGGGDGDGDGDEDGEVNHPDLNPPVMEDFKNNRFIMCFHDISTMYAYYPSEDRWECVVEDFIGWVPGGEPVTLADDGVIYVHNTRIKAFFRAYDTVTKEWLNVRLSPEAEAHDDYQSYLHHNRYPTLLHRGNGLLCLLVSILDLAHIVPTFVHVVQFKVELVKIDDSKEVLVTPLSSQCYHLDSRCSVFIYLPV